METIGKPSTLRQPPCWRQSRLDDVAKEADLYRSEWGARVRADSRRSSVLSWFFEGLWTFLVSAKGASYKGSTGKVLGLRASIFPLCFFGFLGRVFVGCSFGGAWPRAGC